MKNTIDKFLSFYENLDFKYKTAFLVFIIAGGMVWIIIFSQIAVFTIKQDFDTLFDTRTKNLIRLENIKDTYNVNVQDTLNDLKIKEITYKQSKEVFELAFQIIDKNWYQYKHHIRAKQEPFFIKQLLIKQNKYYENKILKQSIIKNIDKKLLNIKNIVLKLTKTQDINTIKNLNLEINSISIYITSLINYDLSLAVNEKRDTQESFNTIMMLSIGAIVMVFLFSVLLSILIINNFKNLHNLLEKKVKDKTKELTELNNYLEIKISKRGYSKIEKKDIIMFQQARLASLGEMLNNIAHQWRQPLGSIAMIIQSFQTKMSIGKLTDEYIEAKVNDALLLSTNMSNTLDDFKNFFSPDKAKSKFHIKECIEHSIELSKYLLDKQNITLKLEVKNNVKLNTFYNELSHVFLNIISNSKDALGTTTLKDDKIIKIIVNEYKNYVIVNFIDNGGGIDENIIEKVFEPYYTTKYKSAGTGIGLYMSKQIVEKHMNGSIYCKNILHKIDDINNYKCSLFTIRIPIK